MSSAQDGIGLASIQAKLDAKGFGCPLCKGEFKVKPTIDQSWGKKTPHMNAECSACGFTAIFHIDTLLSK